MMLCFTNKIYMNFKLLTTMFIINLGHMISVQNGVNFATFVGALNTTNDFEGK